MNKGKGLFSFQTHLKLALRIHYGYLDEHNMLKYPFEFPF